MVIFFYLYAWRINIYIPFVVCSIKNSPGNKCTSFGRQVTSSDVTLLPGSLGVSYIICPVDQLEN